MLQFKKKHSKIKSSRFGEAQERILACIEHKGSFFSKKSFKAKKKFFCNATLMPMPAPILMSRYQYRNFLMAYSNLRETVKFKNETSMLICLLSDRTWNLSNQLSKNSLTNSMKIKNTGGLVFFLQIDSWIIFQKPLHVHRLPKWNINSHKSYFNQSFKTLKNW